MNTGTLLSLVTTVIALSVAAERIVELIKGMLPNFWLFLPNASRTDESRRCALLRVVSGACGGVTAMCSGVDLILKAQGLTTPPAPSWASAHGWAAFGLAALLTSAGSAFWNHSLDILKSTKVEKEQAAVAALNKAGAESAIPPSTTARSLA